MKTCVGLGQSLLLGFAILLSHAFDAQAGNAIFLNLSGIPGESVNARHKDEIDVHAFNFDLSNPLVATAGGAGVGKPILNDITVVKSIDRSSPKLAQTLATGLHIKSAKLSVQVAYEGKTLIDYYTVDLEDVTITSVQVSGSVSDSQITEVIRLSFNKVTWTYLLLSPTGSVKETITSSYNKKTGSAE
jgi:type VI secretion system secreted protein Hcp